MVGTKECHRSYRTFPEEINIDQEQKGSDDLCDSGDIRIPDVHRIRNGVASLARLAAMKKLCRYRAGHDRDKQCNCKSPSTCVIGEMTDVERQESNGRFAAWARAQG